jgi:hypothetical protein
MEELMRNEFHANGTETLRTLQHTLDSIWLEMRQSGKVSSANEAEIQVEVCRRIVELIAADVHDEKAIRRVLLTAFN